MLRRICNFLIAVAVLLQPLTMRADVALARHADNFLVLGVIASGEPGHGVALLKSQSQSEAFAVRDGQEFSTGIICERITREYVYFKMNGRIERVRVGEQIESAPYVDNQIFHDGEGGVERDGAKVRVSAAFRDNMVKRQLGQVLMQAAAVPYYVNGQLQGFRLLDIDKGSIYERTGFVNGDLIMSINGQRLTDVGMTIKLLQSLREEPKVDVTLVRSGVEQTIEIVVQ